MRAFVATLLLLAASALAACGGISSGPGGVGAGAGEDATVAELKSFTDELLRAVESAPEPKAGLAEAQRLLDSRRATMAAAVSSLRKSPRLQQDAEARRKWLEAEVDNTDRVSRLQVRYLDASMRDPEFKARLDKFVGDYNSMFRDAPAR